MNLSKWLALMGIFCSSGVFIYFAFKYRQKYLSVEDYLLSNYEVSGDAFANAFVASTFCLSGNMVFFVSNYQAYGWLMIAPPLLLVASQGFIMHWIRNLSIDTDKARTASDLWFMVFPSPLFARSLAYLVAITCFMVVFVELYVGSILATLFIPESPLTQAMTFFILGLLTFSYVRLGGFRTIIKTDKWQLFLILMACTGIGAFALQVSSLNHRTLTECLSLIGSYQAHGWSLWIFVCWSFIINLCLGFADASLWQRSQAARTSEHSVRALWSHSWKMLAVIGLPSMSCVLLGLKGYQFATIPEFLDVINHASGQWSWLLFPIIVVGLAAALFSTADTYMLAAMYTLCDQNTLGRRLSQLPSERQHEFLNRYLTMFSIGLLVLLTIFYYLQSSEIAQYLMPVIYAVWGQMAVVAPLVVYAMYHLAQGRPPLVINWYQETSLVAATACAWLTLILGSVAEVYYADPIYAQLSFFASLVMMLVGLSLVATNQQPSTLHNRRLKSTLT